MGLPWAAEITHSLQVKVRVNERVYLSLSTPSSSPEQSKGSFQSNGLKAGWDGAHLTPLPRVQRCLRRDSEQQNDRQRQRDRTRPTAGDISPV